MAAMEVYSSLFIRRGDGVVFRGIFHILQLQEMFSFPRIRGQDKEEYTPMMAALALSACHDCSKYDCRQQQTKPRKLNIITSST